ncbi:40S ribosomal protein S29 [Chelonia mydas]|nr:40S ribosomal protein S29 [Chelonia mydas]
MDALIRMKQENLFVMRVQTQPSLTSTGFLLGLQIPWARCEQRARWVQQLYWSDPRKFGKGSRSCHVCSNRHGPIRKYGLNMCWQCFRQYAKDIGFVKLD